MERQGGTEEYRRDEALMAVATLSIHDADFLNGLRTNFESTLWRRGFALSPKEMSDARAYFTARADDSDEEIVRDLRGQSESYAELRIWR